MEKDNVKTVNKDTCNVIWGGIAKKAIAIIRRIKLLFKRKVTIEKIQEDKTHTFRMKYHSGKAKAQVLWNELPKDDLEVETLQSGAIECTVKERIQNDGLYKFRKNQFEYAEHAFRGWNIRIKINDVWFWYLDNGEMIHKEEYKKEIHKIHLFKDETSFPKLQEENIQTIVAEAIWKNVTIPETIKQKSDKDILNGLYAKYHLLPIQMNKIVCQNFHGKGFGCNIKYIIKSLLKKDIDLDIVWLVSGEQYVPEGIRKVEINSKEAVYETATARVLIDNQMKFPGFVKRKDQFFIETWHGGIALKKIGYDNQANAENKNPKYTLRVKTNWQVIDIAVSNSKFCTDLYRRTFEYQGYILEKGYPRNDIFFDKKTDYKKMIANFFNISSDKKILLYAPTYRKDRGISTYQLDYQKLLEELGESWILLIRLHPNIQGKAGLLGYNERIINASLYPDMQELMAASDLLVTDYSSVMFEFALQDKPCVIYATDIEEYRKERDYYFDIYNLPFPVTTTTEELINEIKHFDCGRYVKKQSLFKEEVGFNETGHASDIIADMILHMITDKDYCVAKEYKETYS